MVPCSPQPQGHFDLLGGHLPSSCPVSSSISTDGRDSESFSPEGEVGSWGIQLFICPSAVWNALNQLGFQLEFLSLLTPLPHALWRAGESLRDLAHPHSNRGQKGENRGQQGCLQSIIASLIHVPPYVRPTGNRGASFLPLLLPLVCP